MSEAKTERLDKKAVIEPTEPRAYPTWKPRPENLKYRVTYEVVREEATKESSK